MHFTFLKYIKYPYFLILLLSFFSYQEYAQTQGEWTWMHGSTTSGASAVYGTKGVAAPNNTPGGFYEACEWTDLQGNFWLYGGTSASGNFYSDLWKYDPGSDQWRWMQGPGIPNQAPIYGTKGTPSPANTPGARAQGVITWTDKNGNLWLFGGAAPAGNFNNLWKYDPDPTSLTYNQWTWVSGSNTTGSIGVYGTQTIPNSLNVPGARSETSVSWVDNSGNLWLFGGQGVATSINQGDLNDLWKYDINADQWTWMSGANAIDQPGTYGTKGVAGINNIPEGRIVYCKWKDNAGNFWLFGGYGGSLPKYPYNDLWKYDPNPASPTYNQWTWVSGSNVKNDAGVYGTKCIASVANLPGARFENRACWTDSCGKFWLYGGAGVATYSDLWKYDPSSNEWTLANGSGISQPASYGTINVSNVSNTPGQRTGSISWSDNKGNFWLFGGMIIGAGARNDLWRYVPDTTCSGCKCNIVVTTGTNSAICSGDAVTLNATGGNTYSWYPSQGLSDPSIANPSVSPSITTTYTVTVTDPSGLCTATATQKITVNSSPIANAGTDTSILYGNSISLLSTGNGTYQWSPFLGLSCATCQNPIATPLQTTTYTLTITAANGCTAQDVVTVFVDILCEDVYVPTAFSPGSSNTNNSLECVFGNCIKNINFSIFDRWGKKVFESTDPTKCWNGTCKGKQMNSAVFVYVLEAVLIDGKQITKKGNISLIR